MPALPRASAVVPGEFLFQCRVLGLGLWGLGFRSLGFRVSGFRGLGFRSLGFRVSIPGS